MNHITKSEVFHVWFDVPCFSQLSSRLVVTVLMLLMSNGSVRHVLPPEPGEVGLCGIVGTWVRTHTTPKATCHPGLSSPLIRCLGLWFNGEDTTPHQQMAQQNQTSKLTCKIKLVDSYPHFRCWPQQVGVANFHPVSGRVVYR